MRKRPEPPITVKVIQSDETADPAALRRGLEKYARDVVAQYTRRISATEVEYLNPFTGEVMVREGCGDGATRPAK